MIGGTLPYMAPEHLAALRTGAMVGPSSDIYSVGVILFQLLTGRLPHPIRHGSVDEVVDEMIDDRWQPLPAIRSLNAAITPGLAAIVDRCLAADPECRYTTARELHEDLQCHLDDRPLRHVPNRNLAERCRKWVRRHPRLASATTVAAVGFVIIVALGIAVWSRGARLAVGRAGHTAPSRRGPGRGARGAQLPAHRRSGTRCCGHGGGGGAGTAGYHRRIESRDAAGLSLADRRGPRACGTNLPSCSTCWPAARPSKPRGCRARRSASSCGTKRCATTRWPVVWLAIAALPAFSLQRTRILAASHRKAADAEPPQVASSTPPEPMDLRTLASEYAQQFRYEDAAKALEDLAASESAHDHTLWFCLGNCYLSMQQYLRAADCFTAAVALRPHFMLGYEHRGLARLCAKDYAGACRDFDTVLEQEQEPKSHSALVNRAIARECLGENESAIQDLTRALESGCTATRVYFLRASLLAKLGDAAHAADDRHTGLQRTPSDELSWVARGVARLNEDPRAALADFQQALDVNPRSQSALQNTAHVLSESLNDLDGAIGILTQWLVYEPDNAGALVSRAVLLARQGNREDSLHDVQAALGVSAEPLILYQAGCVYALLSADHPGDRHVAHEFLARALQADVALAAVAAHDADLTAPVRRSRTARAVVRRPDFVPAVTE